MAAAARRDLAQVNARPPGPHCRLPILYPQVRGVYLHACSPSPRVQDCEALVGGAPSDRVCDGSVYAGELQAEGPTWAALSFPRPDQGHCFLARLPGVGNVGVGFELYGWVALGLFWLLTCPVFPLGIASSRSHLVVQLEQEEERWVPDQVDATPAAGEEAQKGSGPGCWCGVEDKDTSSEQSVSSEGVAQVRTPVAGMNTHPHDMSGPILKDRSLLTDYHRGRASHKPLTYGACGKPFWLSTNCHQHQEQRSGERPFTKDNGRDSPKSCRTYVPQKIYTCGARGVGFPATSGRPQHQVVGEDQRTKRCFRHGMFSVEGVAQGGSLHPEAPPLRDDSRLAGARHFPAALAVDLGLFSWSQVVKPLITAWGCENYISQNALR
ncbi:hypothetical protein MC885_021750 [Smutsia gigantea]|nr:hypothetical protein MC885_021750 [Smutsia gigantea]